MIDILLTLWLLVVVFGMGIAEPLCNHFRHHEINRHFKGAEAHLKNQNT